MAVDESFAERARRRRREAGANWTEEDERRWLEDHPDDEPALDVGEDWSKYAPDFEDDVSPESLEVDNFLSSLDIIDAYNRWAGKGQVSNPGNKTEGIMIRCPNPAHPDHNPSAWINTDKQVYSCGGCGMEGGDIYVIAAYAFGYPVPIPRQRFPELKKQMAENLGWQIKQVGTKKYVQPIPQSDEPDEDAAEDEPPPRERAPFPRERRNSEEDEDSEDDKTDGIATVHPITPQQGDDDSPETVMPEFDWRAFVHDGTFLEQWMKDAHDNLPDEYYFWLGLAAVGLAARDRAVLKDITPVKGNLFICLTGLSGVGKTRATYKVKQLMKEALPEGTDGSGVRMVSTPSSGEALIDTFNEVYTREVLQSDGTYADQIFRHKIAGLVEFREFEVLIKRSSWSGSTLKPILIEFFDAFGDITNTSRTHGTTEAREPYATIISAIQPGLIRHLLATHDTESGFLNRWIFVGGEPRMPELFSDSPFDPTRSAEKLRAIASRYNVIGEDDPPALYSFDADALDHFSQYFRNVIWPMKLEEENELFNRADLMIKKFSLLFMLDRGLKSIDLDCVKDSIKLWDYMEEMYKIIGANIGLGEFDYCKAAIRKALDGFHRRHGHGPKPKQFMAMMNRDTRFSSDLIEKVLQSMIRLEEVDEMTTQDKGGNITTRYINANVSS